MDGWPVALFVLTAVNAVVFVDHYRGLIEIPWDFPSTYYAMVAYWTTAVRHGVLPEWVPYQQMGYPLMMNLQTGIGYPPLWVFPLTGIPYTLHAAVIFQVLHVLLGSIGAYALGRAVFGKGLPALFLALAWHFFGGFYSNAQHVDIVRAYAWLPWLLWCVYFRPGQHRLEARNLAIPTVVAMAITSSYPGNIASHLFIAGISLVTPFLLATRPVFRLLPRGLALIIVGILLSSPVLYPAWAFKDQLLRSAGAHPVQGPWPIENWPYLFIPWQWEWPHHGDISMGSALIPLATLLFLAMLRKATLLRSASWALILVVALAMLPGEASWFATALKRLVPFMGYSRFPSSDYRAPLALALLLLASASLDHAIRSGTAVARSTLVSSLWLPCLCLLAFATGQSGWAIPLRVLAILLTTLTASVGTLWLAFSDRSRARTLGGVGFLAVVALSGYWTVTESSFTWSEGAKEWFEKGLGYAPNAPPPIEPLLTHPPAVRPARHDTPKPNDFSWKGYLDGSYQMREMTGSQFSAQTHIVDDPELLSWMGHGWENRTLPGGLTSTPEACELLQQRVAEAATDPAMTSLQYGVNDIRYQVRLTDPAVVVENEIYFRGWKGTIVEQGREPVSIAPEAVCGGLRAWRLPAGEYQLQSHFETPYLRSALTASGLLLLLYLAWAARAGWTLARSEGQPAHQA